MGTRHLYWIVTFICSVEGVEGADNFYLSNTTQVEGDGADCGRVEGNVHEGQAMFQVYGLGQLSGAGFASK